MVVIPKWCGSMTDEISEPDGHVIQTRHALYPENDWPEGFSEGEVAVADLRRPDPSVHLLFVRPASPWVYAYWVTSSLAQPSEPSWEESWESHP